LSGFCAPRRVLMPLKTCLSAHKGFPTARRYSGDGCGRLSAYGSSEGERRLGCSLARGLLRSGRARAVEPDDGRRDRRDRRPDDPHRRSLARRFRVVQLPRFRPRSRGHGRDPGIRREVGHAPELVAAPREPGALRADRGAPHRAARSSRRARVPDHHLDPPVRDPAARGERNGVRRPSRSQDDLRGRRAGDTQRRDVAALRAQRPRPARVAPAQRSLHGAADLHRRSQQHDRQRRRPRLVRVARTRARGDPLRRRRSRLRGDR